MKPTIIGCHELNATGLIDKCLYENHFSSLLITGIVLILLSIIIYFILKNAFFISEGEKE